METELRETRKDVKLIGTKLYGNGNQGLVSDVVQNRTKIKGITKTIRGIETGLIIGFTALGILITFFSVT